MTAGELAQVLAVHGRLSRRGREVAVVAVEEIREVAGLEGLEQDSLGLGVGEIAPHGQGLAAEGGALEGDAELLEAARPWREREGAVHDVPELPDVARPAVGEQPVEARLGGRLGHRNIVGVHDLGVDRGVYYVRMDLVDGPDLGRVSRQAPLPRPLALFVAEEIAAALEHVHSVADGSGRPLGLVHRDVSPQNVLLSRSGEVKLADFGIARATVMVADLASWVRGLGPGAAADADPARQTREATPL